ncbi:hypothetical protein HID58_013191 [Brassica napus]|uniref:BnaA03g50950D protein n=2 Tax=Brassica napus TaxID=3708 RepID=A0A078IH33_BRANA|nr:hypothetical protein HID58_013191 [Brassica napus]CAF2132969.1 unnamed protein product [Brassica napus]CDY49282.1 BnaA03g50950D [Brassica napus]
MNSFKSAFIVLLILTVVISVTVQIGEARRMLQEEKSLPVLDHQVSKLVVKFCPDGCHSLCFATTCGCVCHRPPKP